MAERKKAEGGDLFIVDNSNSEWKVLQYLSEWCEIARAFDIATGYFEIGSLLALDGLVDRARHGGLVRVRPEDGTDRGGAARDRGRHPLKP